MGLKLCKFCENRARVKSE